MSERLANGVGAAGPGTAGIVALREAGAARADVAGLVDRTCLPLAGFLAGSLFFADGFAGIGIVMPGMFKDCAVAGAAGAPRIAAEQKMKRAKFKIDILRIGVTLSSPPRVTLKDSAIAVLAGARAAAASGAVRAATIGLGLAVFGLGHFFSPFFQIFPACSRSKRSKCSVRERLDSPASKERGKKSSGRATQGASTNTEVLSATRLIWFRLSSRPFV